MTSPYFSDAPLSAAESAALAERDAAPFEVATPDPRTVTLQVRVPTVFTVEELWSSVLGSGWEGISSGWVKDSKEVECEWNRAPIGAGCLRVTAEADDGHAVTVDVTAEVLVSAVQAFIDSGRVDVCTGEPVQWVPGELDLDACVGDDVLQLAVLRKVVYS